MSEAIVSVFRSEHPGVQAWMFDQEEAFKRFAEKVNALKAEYPGFDVAVKVTNTERYVTGLIGDNFPEPYRYFDKVQGVYVPRTGGRRAGEHAERFDIRMEITNAPGMPVVIFYETKRASAGLHRIKDTLWAEWGVPGEIVVGAKSADPLHPGMLFDAEAWEQTRLSAYYLAREAAEDEARNLVTTSPS